MWLAGDPSTGRRKASKSSLPEDFGAVRSILSDHVQIMPFMPPPFNKTQHDLNKVLISTHFQERLWEPEIPTGKINTLNMSFMSCKVGHLLPTDGVPLSMANKEMGNGNWAYNP